MGDASLDILADIDDHISSSSFGMEVEKVSKLLLYLGVHSRVGGEEVVRMRTLPQAIIELGDMKSFENLNKTDVVRLRIWSLP